MSTPIHRYAVEILRRGQGDRGGSCGSTSGYVSGASEPVAYAEAEAWAAEHGSDVHRFLHDPECPACRDGDV